MVVLMLAGVSCQASGSEYATTGRATSQDTASVRVDFERSGGFAGVPLHLGLDSDTLAPARARELRQLIGEAGFFELPAEIADSTPQPDRFEYRVTVAARGRRHSIRVTEAAVPATLRPLLDWLTQAASAARRPR